MSQFTLTAEEDAILLDAIREKANQYHMMYGAADPTLEALAAKVSGQFTAPVVEVVEETPAPKAKKAKASTSDE
jgi:hypothetical protein